MPPAGPSHAASVAGGRPRGPSVRSGEGGSPVRAILGFVLRFAAIWAALLFSISRFPQISEWAVAGTVGSLRLILGAAGLELWFDGDSFRIGQVIVKIVYDCTPVAPTAGLWAAMLAFPAPAPWKMAGLAGGAVALWFYNLARILLLLPVMLHYWPLYEALHAYVWQTLTLAVVCCLFAIWHRLEPRARGAA